MVNFGPLVCRKSPDLTCPPVHLAPTLGLTSFEFCAEIFGT